jgi:hypothetical protein
MPKTAADSMLERLTVPLPPHIRMDQAKAFASAIFKGDPEAWETIKPSIKGKAKEFATR